MANPNQPTKLQQSFIDAGGNAKWVCANIKGKAPKQGDLAAWRKLLSPLAEMVDVNPLAEAAHDVYYSVSTPVTVAATNVTTSAPQPAHNDNGAQNIVVTVNQPKQASEMAPGELLQQLVVDPTNDDYYQALLAHPRIMALMAKTHKIMALQKGGGFVLDVTQRYWQRLANKDATPLDKFSGYILGTIEAAIGRIEKILIHPLIAGEKIISGFDNDGLDWSLIDRERMEMALWARQTKQSLFPKVVDPFSCYSQLKADEMDERWQTLLELYQHFKNEGGQPVSLVFVDDGQDPQDARKPLPTAQATDATTGERRGLRLEARW